MVLGEPNNYMHFLIVCENNFFTTNLLLDWNFKC